jgi:crossover junction endodeoxyribonuclease RusA
MMQKTLTPDQVRATKRSEKRKAEKEVVANRPKRKTSAQFYAGYLATPPAPAQSELFERHDKAVLSIRLPLAPGANNLKSIRQLPGRAPFLVPSTQFNAYKKAVAKFWGDHWKGCPPEPLTGRLRVLILVHQVRKGGDVANREKALCDSLSECGAWGDDSQIDDLRVLRGDVIPGVGALDVTIETILGS